MNWPSITLAEVCTKIGSGATPRGGDESYKPSGIALVRSMNVHHARFKRDGLAFIDAEQAALLDNVTLQDMDVLINITGASVARCCLLDGSILPARVNQHVCILRSAQDKINPAYLMRFLTSSDSQRKLNKIAESGATRQAITKAELNDFEIPLPPLAEQKRIAGILDAADALRAKRREALAQLDTLLQATFLDLFGDPVTNPKGWETRKFDDLSNDSFRNGLSPSTKGEVDGEVLTLSAITGGRFKFHERKEALFDRSPSTLQMLSTDTFLICRGNGNKCLVGAGAFPDRSAADICFPDTMIGVTIDPEVLAAPYLQFVWASGHVRRQIESGARTTNGTFKVNQQTLGAVAFPVPPIIEQKRFAIIATVIEKQRAVYDQHLAELDTLFASLQSRAFRGEL